MAKQTRLSFQSNDLQNDDEIQLSHDETAMGGNCLVDFQSSTIPANQVMIVEFTKPADDTYCSTVSGAKLVEIVSEGKVSKGQNSVNVYSSSDEEEESASKNQEIRKKRSRRHRKDKRPSLNKMIYSLPLEMPVVPKQGCLNSSWYISLIAELKDLQDNGDFEGHERRIKKELAKTRAENIDLQASLEIERAVALYMQGNVNLKEAKKIAKDVLGQEKKMTNPEVLTARALNLLTSIYKSQRKLVKARKCVEQATTALKDHDSPVDRAELYQSYAGYIRALPVGNCCPSTPKETAYNSYIIAYDCATDPGDKKYIIVKMAKSLLGSDDLVSENDVVQAKKLLNFIEHGPDADNLAVGIKISLLLLRSELFRLEGNVAMAMEKACDACAFIKKFDGFANQLASAQKQIHRLSEIFTPECGSSKGAVGDGSSSD